MNNTKTNTLPSKLKAERSMPKWVTEANDRIGPKPPAPPPSASNGVSTTFRPPALPPKKNQPEPDYEVIEFSSQQQYSNEPTTMRPKTPDTRRPESAMKCTLCGSNNPWVTCDECAQQIFCASCDDMFHKHPKRKTHLRKAIELKKGSTPLIPPKALTPTAPVAPPRRNKKGMPSPMPLRRDQVIGSAATTPAVSPVPGHQPAWQDRLGSLRRGLNLGSRPLPETPRTPSDGVSSRSTTPNSKSVFDSIQKPPSITLEKIKSKASATLDRMALLQQRYRQHKQSKPNDKLNGQKEHMLPSDQWSNISSPSQFRTGSMSSGINSFEYPDESPFHFNQQMGGGGGMRNNPSARNMSSSVFNLNHMSQRHRDHQSPMWMGGNQMQQAQSMAQLNCINCHSHGGGWNPQNHHSDDWPGAANSNLNRSNMSLNVPHGFYPHNQHMMHPPPMFMNMPGMYPYPMGVPMPPMNPGMMGMPTSGRSRVASRASSRVPSPTHSRKSMQVRSKKRNDFSENELTDDEDSENDDRRSLMSQRSGMVNARRTRRVSSVSQALEEEQPRNLRSKNLNSKDRRGPSMPKSVPDEWIPTRRPSTASNANSNFNSYRKVYSDSPISPDSETSEAPPARALVQAKIQEKMKESSSRNKPKPLVLSDNETTLQSPEPKSPLEIQEKVEYQNGNDSKQPEEVSATEDSSSLGPPPSTPEHEWECEFCTFVNEPKTKICSICCKTPQRVPQKVEPAAKTASVVTNGVGKTKVAQQTEDEREDHTEAQKQKDNEPIEDIWATLEENIQAEAKKVTRNAETITAYKTKDQGTDTVRASSVTKEKEVQKVSTGCGPSPPKEIKKELRSTATSPVPQNISTQTYDAVPKRNEEEDLENTAGSNDMLSSDFQNHSFTPPTRNFSPKETFPLMADASTSRDAENLAFIDRNMRFYRDMPSERYRSSNDIRTNEPPSMVYSRPPIPDYISIQKEAEHYKFTAEELHAALKNCGDAHPIVWLRENWSKLIQTVQSLATKYGQERIENVIGTISAIEAREALRLHGGNVWQAISECIEQRQRKYLEISAKGNYSREDIVTALTAHHGNMDLALLDLSKTQLKPFLMRVWGSPGGVENESSNFMQTQPPAPPKTEVSSPIHEFLSANADQIAFTQDQNSYRNASPYSQTDTKSDASQNNKNVLKDLEILIGNMEQVQARQNGQVLRSMEDMLGNLLAKKSVEAENDSESERIFMKSPIYSNRNVASVASNKAGDVKNFVWQHIQEIVPNLVEQVERDLLQPSPPLEEVEEEAHPHREPPPIDADEFLMEEVIRPNLKHSSEEEVPQVEMEDVVTMEDFKTDDSTAVSSKQKEEYTLKSLRNAPHQVFKVEVAPKSESEEESSEEETTEEEDSQEEISSRDIVRQSRPTNEDLETKNTITEKEDPAPSFQKLEATPANVEEVIQPETPVSTAEDNAQLDAQKKQVQNNNELENVKKEPSQGYRGYVFRFGFNSSRRSRKQKARRVSQKEKKKHENDSRQSPENNTSTEVIDQQLNEVEIAEPEKPNVTYAPGSPSEEKTQSDPILTSNISQQAISEDINGKEKTTSPLKSPDSILVEDLQNEVLPSVEANEDLQVVEEVKDAKEMIKKTKKRSKIPSSSKPKQIKSSSSFSSNVQSNEVKVDSTAPSSSKNLVNQRQNTVEEMSAVKNEQVLNTNTKAISENNETSSDSKSEAETSQIKETGETVENKRNEEDINPTPSSSRKDSQLKKIKPRIPIKETSPKKSKTMVNKSSNSNTQIISEPLNSKLETKTEKWESSSNKVKIVQENPKNIEPKTKDSKVEPTNSQQETNDSIGESTEPPSSSNKTVLNTETLKSTTKADTNESSNNEETPNHSNSVSSETENNEDVHESSVIAKLESENAQVSNGSLIPENATNGLATPHHHIESSLSSKKKPTSKIPVRRTTSSTSLKSIESSSNSLTQTPSSAEISSKSPFNFEQQVAPEIDEKDFSTEDDELYEDVQSSSSADEPDFYNAIEDVIQPTVSPSADISLPKPDDEISDQELLSAAGSDDLNTLSTRDLMQSPTSENEVLLVLENQSSVQSTTITPVSSSKSIDFKYSDPSKQNLSELVEDTQRLIKQMKEEINIDMAAYDSEDDDDDYSDEYSYEEYEEEYEEDEENESEEYEEEATENDEEYSNVDVDSNADGSHDNDEVLEDVQEETALQQIQIDAEEKLEPLHTTSPTDHSSLVVLEPSGFTNESNLEQIDLNPNSVVPGVSNKIESVAGSSSPEHVATSNLLIESENIAPETGFSDTLVVKGLKEVQTEMKKVLQDDSGLTESENQGTQLDLLGSEIENIESSANNTSNTIKDNKRPEQKSKKNLPNSQINQLLSTNSNLEDRLDKLISENKSTKESKDINSSVNLDIEDNISQSGEINANSLSSSAALGLQQTSEQFLEEYLDQNTNQVINNVPAAGPSPNDILEEDHDDDSSILRSSTVDEAVSDMSSEPIKIVTQKEFLQTDKLEPSKEPNVPTNTVLENSQEKEASENPPPKTFPNSKDLQNNLNDIASSSTNFQDDNLPSSSKASTALRKSPPKKPLSKIPKPKITSKVTSVPTRSKSFSAPSPIGVSSVRAIQQELFNKQAQLSKTQANTLLRSSPPKLVRKKSITDAISRFTQATSEHAVQRSRTQPKISKIPKKKYHETCFSDDDYQDTESEDEEPPPVEARLRKHSAPVFRTYASIKELQIEKPEICAKRLIDEQLVSNMAEAQIAAALVEMRFQQDVSIWAAKECCDLDQAIALLQQECELCMGSYPLNQIVSMLKCTHKCCKQCAKNYFTIQITDRSINDCNCPFCKTPELHDPNVLEDENLEYFSNLDIFIKNIVEPEVHELFQRKLRDRTLMQDPNFKWCIQCSSGFFARPKQKRLICPDCGSVTCSQCRKTWEKQHEGLTCEKFQAWKDANDPEIQAKGVAEHLAVNGIDCPKCRFKYSLARGGCMHFTCTQCKFEFCYGCGRPFMMGAKCTVSPYCSKLGLHSHHPRSCLFYLRDKEPHKLQDLLKQNNVSFDISPVSAAEGDGAKSASKCPIPLQKETPKGLFDTVCNAEVQKDHAGLCRQHYVEYLAGKVSKAEIDPLPILDLTDCVQELRRRGLPLPERGPWDTDEIYRDMCAKVIKEKIPL